MNFPVQQLYAIEQPYQIHNNNSVEYNQPSLQPLSNEEENYHIPNHHLMTNNLTSFHQPNDSQFVPIFDPHCRAYMAQLPQTINGSISSPLYSIPAINPIANGNNPMNYQFNYSTNDNDGYYMGLQNTNFMTNPNYYRTMMNLNHIRPFIPQMNYQSNHIAVLNNIQVNSIDPVNYLTNNYTNLTSNNIESRKIASGDTSQTIPKRIPPHNDKNGSYKTQDNYKKTFKSVRNKSKSMSVKSTSINSLENGNKNKSPSIHRMPNTVISDESSESNLSNGQYIELLVTNLDYNISAKEWKKLLMNQFQNAIKRVHNVMIQTQSDGSNCGIVRVNTMEDARLAISQFHRKKIGYKRIQVNLVNSNCYVPLINIKQEVATLLKSVAGYSLSVYKFIELYEKKYHRNICISDFYKMKDFVEIKDVGGNQNWKIISLTNTAINSITNTVDSSELNDNIESIVCVQHCKEGTEDYTIVIESVILPNVEISLKLFKEQVHKILHSHDGNVQLMSFLCCYKAEFNDIKVMKSSTITASSIVSADQFESEMLNNIRDVAENAIVINKSPDCPTNFHSANEIPNSEGVPLEHLLNCVVGIKIVSSTAGFKNIQWDERKDGSYKAQDQLSGSTSNYNQSLNGLGGILVDRLHQFSREVVDLMKHQPGCRMFLSKFIPTYHHHFGKQCRVADYGFSKLHELIEALPQVVHVIGTGYMRILYLGHKVQVRRFTNEMMKVLKSKTTKICRLSEYPTLYKILFHKDFHVSDYGVCFIEDLLNEIPESTVEIINNEDGIYIAMPKRIQTSEEKERTAQFAIEVVDLLKQSPRCRLPFNKFIPSYHHHFSRQCKVAEYGFAKLIELLDSVPHVIQIIEEHGEKFVILTQYEMLRALAEQTLNILEKSFNKRIQLSEFPNLYLKTQGYILNLEDYGVTSVQQLMEKIPKITKIQGCSNVCPINKMRSYNSQSDVTDQTSLSDTDDKDIPIEQNELFIFLADRNHIKYLAHKVLLILLEIPSGSLPDYQFIEKFRYKYREEPNFVLIQNEMDDIVQIVNDSSLLHYPGSIGVHIKLKSLILFSRDLKELMRFNQCKMPIIQLEGYYEAHFGIPLKCQYYGYPSLFSLIQACDFVVTLKGRGIRAALILCQDFVGKLAYRVAYNTQPIQKMIEDTSDHLNCQRLNSIPLNSKQSDDNDESLSNLATTMNNQIVSTVNSVKPACAMQSSYNHNIYPQNNFLPTLNAYPYFNPPPIYNPWFRQWYQPHPPYGYTPNIYSHPEFGVVSLNQSTVSTISGSQNCTTYVTASQDQKQIDELVETLAYDNSCSSTLTPPPSGTFPQIQHSIEANNSIINNSWLIYPPHQIMPSNAILPGFITAVSNGDNHETQQTINKMFIESEDVQCTNNNNQHVLIEKNFNKINQAHELKFAPLSQMSNLSKFIT